MSDAQAALTALQIDTYSSLAVITAVAYDYILTFPDEIHYIWSRPWSWISTIFIIVRYIGIFCAMTGSLIFTVFMPGPVQACTVIFVMGNSAFTVFLSAADLVMLLRVYALYGRSKIILGILLVVYIASVVLLVVATAEYTNLKALSVGVVQMFGVTLCEATSSTPSNLGTYSFIPRFVLSGLMCLLSVVQFLRESYKMYRLTKRWQPNRYVRLFVKEGVLYFVINQLYNIFSLIEATASEATYLAFTILCYVFLYILIPRFIMNVRELYTQDVHFGEGIDTGFGIRSRGGRSSGVPVVGDLVFAIRPEEGSETGEDIQMWDIGM